MPLCLNPAPDQGKDRVANMLPQIGPGSDHPLVYLPDLSPIEAVFHLATPHQSLQKTFFELRI